MSRRYRCALVLALLATPGADASAGPAECEVIKAAMLAVQDQPAVRQSVVMKEKDGVAMRMDSLLFQGATYGQIAGAWRQLPMDAAQRKALSAKPLQEMPITTCAQAGKENLGGLAAAIYSFEQPDPSKPGTLLKSKIWIAEGLPHRSESENGTTMTLEYGDHRRPGG